MLGLRLVIGAFIVGVIYWLTGVQSRFLSEIRSIERFDVQSIEICDHRVSVARDSCEVLNSTTTAKLSATIKRISAAKAALPPGHTPRVAEKMVNIELRNASGETFHKCYLLVDYAGFDESYLLQITADSECRHVRKSMAGSAAIPKL